MSSQMPEEARTHRFVGVAAPQEADPKRSAAEAVRPYRPILARPADLLSLRRIRRRRLEDRPYPIKHRLCRARHQGWRPPSNRHLQGGAEREREDQREDQERHQPVGLPAEQGDPQLRVLYRDGLDGRRPGERTLGRVEQLT